MNDPSARTRVVLRHVAHHGSHSGYDRLFEFMQLTPACSPVAIRLGRLLPGGLVWRLWDLRPQDTGRSGLDAELGALPWVLAGRGRLCHFIYGEDTFFYTALWKPARNRCIATFHYPPDRLIERVNPGTLRSLDAVIIVGENQRAYFSRFLDAERIHFCPHHIDTDFFCPDPATAPAAPLRLICVGQLFRRHDELLAVHRALRAAGVAVETDVVGPASLGGHPIAAEPGVRLHSGVSDEKLRELYRAASIGVLPLSDATANNSLLEMLACGLPVVTSRVGGVADYVAGSSARLCPPGDIAAMTDQVAELAASAELRRDEGRRNRQHACAELSLPRSAERMRAIYRAVLDRS